MRFYSCESVDCEYFNQCEAHEKDTETINNSNKTELWLMKQIKIVMQTRA